MPNIGPRATANSIRISLGASNPFCELWYTLGTAGVVIADVADYAMALLMSSAGAMGGIVWLIRSE